MQLKKNHKNFKVPEDYFNNLGKRLMQSLQQQSSAEPSKDKQGFTLPEHYMEELGARLEAEVLESGKVVSLYRYKWWAVAAAAVVLFGIFLSRTSFSETTPAFEELAANEILEYLENETEDISAYEMAEILPFESLSAVDFMDQHPNEEVIFQYLEDHTETIEDLYFETTDEND